MAIETVLPTSSAQGLTDERIECLKTDGFAEIGDLTELMLELFSVDGVTPKREVIRSTLRRISAVNDCLCALDLGDRDHANERVIAHGEVA